MPGSISEAFSEATDSLIATGEDMLRTLLCLPEPEEKEKKAMKKKNDLKKNIQKIRKIMDTNRMHLAMMLSSLEDMQTDFHFNTIHFKRLTEAIEKRNEILERQCEELNQLQNSVHNNLCYLNDQIKVLVQNSDERTKLMYGPNDPKTKENPDDADPR